MQVPIKEETWESINEFLRLTPEAFEKLPVFREVLDASVRDAEDEGMRIGKQEGKQEGIEQGKQEGIEQGKQVGIEEARRQMIRALRANSFDLATIARLLALPEAEVLRLSQPKAETQPSSDRQADKPIE